MLTVRELKEAIQHLPDETPVLYAWTWLSPKDMCIGRRRGTGSVECLLLDGNLSAKAKKFGNTVLWQEAVTPNAT
jgi:hypothetical protein